MKLHEPFWEMVLGGSNAEKWGYHQKKKFFIQFINNYLKSIKENCDIISVIKATQIGCQWKLYIFAQPMGLNYSLCDDYGF